MPLFRTTPPLGNNLRSLFYCYPPSTSAAPIVRKGIKKAKIRDEDNIHPAPPPPRQRKDNKCQDKKGR